jgi:hypothetical protein
VGKPARVEITVKSGAWVDPVRVLQQISDAGYSPIRADVVMTVTGWVMNGDQPTLTIDGLTGAPRAFTLMQGEDKDAKRSAALADAYAALSALNDQIVEAKLRLRFEQEKDGLRWSTQAVLEAVRLVK